VWRGGNLNWTDGSRLDLTNNTTNPKQNGDRNPEKVYFLLNKFVKKIFLILSRFEKYG
jgi:hypothetical protein